MLPRQRWGAARSSQEEAGAAALIGPHHYCQSRPSPRAAASARVHPAMQKTERARERGRGTGRSIIAAVKRKQQLCVGLPFSGRIHCSKHQFGMFCHATPAFTLWPYLEDHLCILGVHPEREATTRCCHRRQGRLYCLYIHHLEVLHIPCTVATSATREQCPPAVPRGPAGGRHADPKQVPG